MNNSKNELKKYLDDRAKNLYQRIIQSNLATPERVKGCSSSEIAQIEQTYNLSLPYSYKVFLRHFGHSIGGIANDVEFLYPSPLLLTQDMRDAEREMQEEGEISSEELLPPNAFIFAMRQRMQSWYFLASKGVEDPAVFYDSGDGIGVKTHESIFDLWEAEVKLEEELLLKKRKERERRREQKEEG